MVNKFEAKKGDVNKLTDELHQRGSNVRTFEGH